MELMVSFTDEEVLKDAPASNWVEDYFTPTSTTAFAPTGGTSSVRLQL